MGDIELSTLEEGRGDTYVFLTTPGGGSYILNISLLYKIINQNKIYIII